jgi:hypothetical protein
MLSFQDWLLQQESSASTRARAEAARGLRPWSGSLHGHSTASPFEVKQFKKYLKKKRRRSKKRSVRRKTAKK